MYVVYVLFSGLLNKYYTGFTSDLEKRLKHHNLGLDRWSKRGVPWNLVYQELFKTKKDALRREKFLKTGKGRDFIFTEVAKVVTARV